MTIQEADIRPDDETDEPPPAPPEPDFPWLAVLLAAAVGALLGAGITALVLLGRPPAAGSSPENSAIMTGVLVTEQALRIAATEVIR